LLTRRLYAIQRVADGVQAGESELRAVVPGNDEAAQLARQFNGMLDSLAQRNEQLRSEIAERKRAEEELKLAKEAAEESLQNERVLNAAIVESSEDAIIGETLDGIITSWNRGAEKVFGYLAQEMVGQPVLALIPPERSKEEDEELSAIRRGESIKHYETERICKSGDKIAVSMTVSSIRDRAGRIIGASKIVRDITEHKQLESQIRQLAFHDPLTHLPNRRLLNDRLSQIMATTKRSSCYGAVMFLDLDNFKPLNDTYGHEVGDLLLIEVADRLRSCVRQMDTVGRFGGDEFVVMLSELNSSKDASTTQAKIVAEKICALLSEPYSLSIRRDGSADTTIEYHCTASVGVVLFIDHEASQDDILKWADSAMYQAKEAGRNLIRFYGSNTG
jgi:diguanylate cyclase (GGDEF)-like protein/PAS domain S-box-containing protein